MADYIDREAVLMKLMQDGRSAKNVHTIMGIPAADVEPVRHGHWKGFTQSRFFGCDTDGNPIYRDGVIYYCSRCDQRSIIK